jgi:hypothetical protein
LRNKKIFVGRLDGSKRLTKVVKQADGTDRNPFVAHELRHIHRAGETSPNWCEVGGGREVG